MPRKVEDFTCASPAASVVAEKVEVEKVNLPLTVAPYTSNVLFPFFDGLIPEGWLLEVAEKNWKLNPRDRMGLLLACCKECIGAVSVEELREEDAP